MLPFLPICFSGPPIGTGTGAAADEEKNYKRKHEKIDREGIGRNNRKKDEASPMLSYVIIVTKATKISE